MKKHLLKIGAACLALAFTSGVFAQHVPVEVTIGYTEAAPTVDGDAADWAGIPAHDVVTAFGEETVSMVSGSNVTFKAVWDDDNMYVLVEVPDDNYINHSDAAVNPWEADLVELYFDVNATKVDGGGPSDQDGTTDDGHIQVAINGVDGSEDYGFVQTVNEDGTWLNEYSIPFAMLLDGDATALDPYSRAVIGFDITVIDLDAAGEGGNETMGRVNYSNNTQDAVDGGVAGESWTTLDQSADLTFSTEPISVKERASNVNVLVSNMVDDVLEFNVEVSNVQVFNSVGQVVATTANVSNLNKGVYIVAVETANGTVANRFVKK